MKECPLHQTSIASKIIKSGDNELVLCEIEKGTCPYENEGDRISILRNSKQYSICETEGMILEEEDFPYIC